MLVGSELLVVIGGFTIAVALIDDAEEFDTLAFTAGPELSLLAVLVDTSVYSVAMFSLWTDFCVVFTALAATGHLEGLEGLGSTVVFPDLVRIMVDVA